MAEAFLTHSIFGKVIVKTNKLARSVIIRVIDQQVVVTVPPFAKKKFILNVLDAEQHRIEKQLTLQQKAKELSPPLYVGMDVALSGFRFIVEADEEQFYIHRKEGELKLVVPHSVNLSDSKVVELIGKNIAPHLRYLAENYLVDRMKVLANRHNIRIGRVSITHGKKRLGSCSSQGDIQLSYYLTMMPTELSDYVMLHELAHRTEMNHSPRFYAVLDSYTNGRARKLRQALKEYRRPL